MKQRYHAFRRWLYAVAHAYSIAKLCQHYAAELGHRESVNELTRNSVIVALRGTDKGWSASVGKRYLFRARSLGEILRVISEAE